MMFRGPFGAFDRRVRESSSLLLLLWRVNARVPRFVDWNAFDFMMFDGSMIDALS